MYSRYPHLLSLLKNDKLKKAIKSVKCRGCGIVIDKDYSNNQFYCYTCFDALDTGFDNEY